MIDKKAVLIDPETGGSVSFDLPVRKIRLNNTTPYTLYYKANEEFFGVSEFSVGANESKEIEFDYLSTLYLRLDIGAGADAMYISVDVLEYFNSVMAATLTPNTQEKFDFLSTVKKFTITNFGIGTAYFKINQPFIDGNTLGEYRIDEGQSVTDEMPCNVIYVKSTGSPYIQVVGRK